MKRKNGTIYLLTLLVAMNLSSISIRAQGDQIGCNNTSRYIGDGRWECDIFISAPPELLARIARIEYRLPDSFREPPHAVNELGDPSVPFLYRLIIRGKFPISARIVYTDGRSSELSYRIHIEEQKIDRDLGLRVRYETERLADHQSGWTAYLSGPNEILRQVRLVKYSCTFSLVDMMSRSPFEVLERGLINRSFAVSGFATENFSLDLCVYFNDGRTQTLSTRIVLSP